MYPAKVNADGVDLERLLRRYQRLNQSAAESDGEKKAELVASLKALRSQLLVIRARIDEVLQ